MNNNFCIIKVYAETNNEYVVKEGLTFDEAQAEFERLNSSRSSFDEPCMFIIGDGIGSLESEVISEPFEDDDEFVTDEELYGYTGFNPVNV